jgi:predicted DNA-binding protein (UPF0251 family)
VEQLINYEDDEFAMTREQLEPLAQMVARMQSQQRAVEDLEAQLKEAKRVLRRIEELDIPTLMDEVGLEQVTMADGMKLSVKETLYASIAAKNKSKAAQWLIEHNQASLVKEDVVVPFDRGQLELVAALESTLNAQGYTYKVQESMNTASVKAAIKELLEQGIEVPLELFGAHFVRKAVLS